MPLQWKSYELNEQAVDDISESIGRFLDNEGIERRNAVRIRLAMEELMLRIIDAKGNAFPVSFGMGRQYGKHAVCLKYEGEAFDPTSGDDENWNERILVSLGLSPDWRYRKKNNTVSIRISGASGQSALFYIFAAVLAALLFGFSGRFLEPSVREEIDTILLTPMMGGFLGLLNTFAGIMIGFTICSGVLGVGDSESLGKIGKGLVLRLFLISLSIAAFSLLFASLFMDLSFSAASVGGTSELDDISKMIFGILPSDPVSPFLNCNTMQIIVISLFAGIAMLTMDANGSTLRRLVEECTTVTQMLTSTVCKLVPGFVFIALLRQIWSGAAAKLLTLWKPLALIAAAVLIITAFLLLFTALKTRKSPVFLLKWPQRRLTRNALRRSQLQSRAGSGRCGNPGLRISRNHPL